jgi:polyisoprenoid-binding protein YceI
MATTKWSFDPTHSELGFKIKHLMISNVSGAFKNFDVQVEMDSDDLTTAKIQATASVESIYTNNEHRDTHLRNSDFFEAEKYPEIKFQSTKIEKADEATYNLYGDLTMKDLTKPIQLTVEYSSVAKDPWGNQRAGFVVTGKLNRNDWGIKFNSVLETGGVALAEEVKINGEIQMVKQVATVAAA